MLYGNYTNGFAYTEGEMETLITEGRATADEFYPIDKYYDVQESENGGEFESSFLKFATKADARHYVKGMQDAHAADLAENLVPYWYTYEYKVVEVKGVSEMRRELTEMPYDKVFDTELCHATGYEVLGDDGVWMNEYADSDGNLHYGN